MGTFPIVDPDHSDVGRTIPSLSPGKSIPVFSPKLNRLIHWLRPSGPRPSASVIVPTFEDFERISATLIVIVGRGSASWMTRSETWIDGASVYFVVGVTMPLSSTPPRVTTL